jgi:uncharacterized protein
MAENGTESLHVEIVYALPGDTTVIPVTVTRGTTVGEAIQLSAIRQIIPDIKLDDQRIGVFNQIVTLKDLVNEGDRIEIYRSLIADPKESRRKRAARSNID